MPLRDSLCLRGHHLLCLYGFRGLGYSKDFVDNLWRVKKAIDKGTLIKVVTTVDEICRACPYIDSSGCKRYPSIIKKRDKKVLEILCIKPNSSLKAGELFKLIERSIRPQDLYSICNGCEWLGLGYCVEGLKRGFVYAG